MTDQLPHSAKRHFKLASQSLSLLRRRRQQSGSVVHFWSSLKLDSRLLQRRRFILWLAGLSLSWLFACYGSVERTEASGAKGEWRGGCVSARRPVWGEVQSRRFCWICLWSLVKRSGGCTLLRAKLCVCVCFSSCPKGARGVGIPSGTFSLLQEIFL